MKHQRAKRQKQSCHTHEDVGLIRLGLFPTTEQTMETTLPARWQAELKDNCQMCEWEREFKRLEKKREHIKGRNECREMTFAFAD